TVHPSRLDDCLRPSGWDVPVRFADRLEVLRRVLGITFDRTLDEQLVSDPAHETARQIVVKLEAGVGPGAGRLEAVERRDPTSARGRAGDLEEPRLLDPADLPAALQVPTTELEDRGIARPDLVERAGHILGLDHRGIPLCDALGVDRQREDLLGRDVDMARLPDGSHLRTSKRTWVGTAREAGPRRGRLRKPAPARARRRTVRAPVCDCQANLGPRGGRNAGPPPDGLDLRTLSARQAPSVRREGGRRRAGRPDPPRDPAELL